MPQIVQQGSVNLTAQVVPGLTVQIVPPQNLVVNGVPTNVVGVVGTAQWGPLNTPVIGSNMSDYYTNFGSIQARTFDMGTHVACAVLQGASDFRFVRVSDGTDTAAASPGVTGSIAYTAAHSGTLGNALKVTRSPGSKTGTWRVTVGMPGLTPEVFDNISGTGNAYWVAEALALNTGIGGQRGPSLLVTAAPGAGTTAPAPGAYAFTGGTDGVAGVTMATLVGLDGTSIQRTGMFTLRNHKVSILDIVDGADSTQWTYIEAFALSEGMYAILSGPPSDTIDNATASKATAGIDTYAIKLMFGDFPTWYDSVNGLSRLVSPVPFVMGRLANLSPEQSSLNKPLFGIQGSQKIGNYSQAELAVLLQAGIDVVGNPSPGGAYWSVLGGQNTSSNGSVNGDNYTRLTNYVASTLAAAMGIYIGEVVTSTHLQNVRSSILSFLVSMLGVGQLGTLDGKLPFSVICDLTNNRVEDLEKGYVTANVQVKYQSINKFFVVNLEGGQTVTVTQIGV